MHQVGVQNLYSLLILYSLSNFFQHIGGQNMNVEAEENMSLPVHACLFVLIFSEHVQEEEWQNQFFAAGSPVSLISHQAPHTWHDMYIHFAETNHVS